MHCPDAKVAVLAGRQHGIVARRQLAELGLTRRAIERRIEAGRLHAVHRGVYAVGHRRLSPEGIWMAAVLIAPGAIRSHRSATTLWGMCEPRWSRPEITVPRAVRQRSGLHIHRAGLRPDEMTAHRGIPVTTPARTLFDLAAVLTPQQLERAATEAEIRRLGSPTALADLVERYPRRPGAPAIRRLLETQAIGRHVTKRELELRFLAFLDAHGLERPRTNARIELEPGAKEVDCLWPEARVVAELDGYATHGTRRAFEEDRARDRALVVAGYRVVRITWRQLGEDGPALARQLRAVTATPGT